MKKVWSLPLKELAITTVLGIAALGLMMLVRKIDPQEIIESDPIIRLAPGIGEVFFSVFGVLYAIIIGLLLVDVLGRYQKMLVIVRKELNALQDIRDFLIYCDIKKEIKHNIKKRLQQYIEKIIDKEWKSMAVEKEKEDSDTSKKLLALMRAVHKMEKPNLNTSDKIAFESIINTTALVTTYRTERLELAEEHLKSPLRYLIIFMSVILVMGFVLLIVESPWIHGFMVFAIVSAIGLLYIVIDDMNHPFSKGLWQIDNQLFKNLNKRLERSLKKKKLKGTGSDAVDRSVSS